MVTYAPSVEVAALAHEWGQLEQTFQDFVNARGLDGTWKRLAQARLPPNVFPELTDVIQGMAYMSGALDDDIRTFIAIHNMNPTRIGVQAAGRTEQAKKVESTWKLALANWDMTALNVGRWLDAYNYEGQIALGVAVNWLRWRKQMSGEAVCGCPVYVEKVLAECIRYDGDWRNPRAAWCKYTVDAVGCDIQNQQGEKPYFTADGALDWYSGEDLPPNYYVHNKGKQIDVIVRDAMDPLAMCPLDGCYHPKRRLTIYVCKKDGKPEDYEEVESYDSPFERCSFILVGGDVRYTERDPHRIFRPSAWVLYQIILEYNSLVTTLLGILKQQLTNDRNYIDPSGTDAATVNQLTTGAEGGNNTAVKVPETAGNEVTVMPGTVRSFPQPSLEGLLARLRRLEQDYAERRPNPALTGQMVASEVSATVGQLQVQGAGVPIGTDLANWDAGRVRIYEEIRHGIMFTSYFEPDGEKTRYMVTVTGKERVYGQRTVKAGDEIYIDAKLAEHPVIFEATTSKDTPSETAQRRMQAITALHEGIYVMEDVDEAWDIYDHEAQEEKRAEAMVDKFIQPLIERAVAAAATRSASIESGVDYGSLLQPENLQPPGSQEGQTHLTEAANAARTMAPTVNPAPTGTPTGGSSSIAT